MQKEKYTTFLQNKGLSESSAKIYWSAIKELLAKYGDNPTIDQINSFIIYKNNKRQPHAKYAIDHYLVVNGREDECKLLPKVKLRNPMKQKHFIDKCKIMEIIENIENKKHRLIAKLQINTGARASEILSINKNKIRKHIVNDRNIAKIRVKGKGDKYRTIYINEALYEELLILCNNVRDYPLLERDKEGFWKGEPIPYLGFWTKVENEYKLYWLSLKKAAMKCDINIATHDLRRSFADLIRLNTKDIYKVQRALGHSDISTTARYFDNKDDEIADTMLSFQDAN